MKSRELYAYKMVENDHLALVEVLRNLYNSSIPYFTKPLNANTWDQQHEWWMKLDFSKVQIHLYSRRSHPWEIIAFSMLTDHGDYVSPVFGVTAQYHGQGYGSEIIEHYLQLANGKPLRGAQLKSNGPICTLNRRMGWRVVSEDDDVQYLEHPNNREQEIYDEIVRYSREGVDG